MWHIVVSICRVLQSGEYPLTPEDAYWMGLVDEVVGSQLPCMRTFAEADPTNGGNEGTDKDGSSQEQSEVPHE